jgi:hypothetical protein
MKNAGFKWTKKRSEAAIMLSLGHTVEETAAKVKVAERTLYNWKGEDEFAEEVDRLSLMTDIAGRAERLRIAKRMIRNMGYNSKKDLLEWLKYAQSETDGVKLELTALLEAATSMADPGQAGDSTEEEVK